MTPLYCRSDANTAPKMKMKERPHRSGHHVTSKAFGSCHSVEQRNLAGSRAKRYATESRVDGKADGSRPDAMHSCLHYAVVGKQSQKYQSPPICCLLHCISARSDAGGRAKCRLGVCWN